jgi:hypothetical protein
MYVKIIYGIRWGSNQSTRIFYFLFYFLHIDCFYSLRYALDGIVGKGFSSHGIMKVHVSSVVRRHKLSSGKNAISLSRYYITRINSFPDKYILHFQNQFGFGFLKLVLCQDTLMK